MTVLRIILHDQLSHNIASLQECDKQNDIILLCELLEDATYVKHHKKKLVLLLSAMRHFAKELSAKKFNVRHIKLDDKKNSGTLLGEVKRAINEHKINHIIATFPGEHRIIQNMRSWKKKLGIPVDIRPDSRFLCPLDEFSTWAKGRKQLRMEYFYREMRKKNAILMNGSKPVGGKWNYDKQNRKTPQTTIEIPKTYHAKPDAITKKVISLISKQFDNHFGDIEPFHFAVTRKQALLALKKFIEQRLAFFGDYQDAMLENKPWMYHSHISFYLNCGLLEPLECVQRAEQAYYDKKAPLNAVEGFIRQIIGWREYVRGIYWLKMPAYARKNFLSAKRNLPGFYWDANTKMNCLSQCVNDTKKHAYAHHIQRLMVLGNFALLTGISPTHVNEWFLIVYADAYQWVELPNVSGMALFADGGLLASKPYASSGSYINKMSNYCKKCPYKVTKKTGKDACPFNYLYWNFLIKKRKKLITNNRIKMIYKTLDKMSSTKKKEITQSSSNFLKTLKQSNYD